MPTPNEYGNPTFNGQKFLALINGRMKELFSAQYSRGAQDAKRVVALNDRGTIDPTMMPEGFGPDTKRFPAYENITAGDFIYIFKDGATAKVRLADASVEGKESMGFVLDGATTGQEVQVYFEGTNTALTGLIEGSRYYLSPTNPGKITTTPPVAPTGGSYVSQYVGRPYSTTAISYEPEDPVTVISEA